MRRILLTPIMLLFATVLVAMASMPLALLAGPRAKPGEIALVIAPPWSRGGAAEVVAAAGGREIGPQRAPFAVFAVFDAPGVARVPGAWAVLDGRLIAAICGRGLIRAEEGMPGV